MSTRPRSRNPHSTTATTWPRKGSRPTSSRRATSGRRVANSCASIPEEDFDMATAAKVGANMTGVQMSPKDTKSLLEADEQIRPDVAGNGRGAMDERNKRTEQACRESTRHGP